MIAYSRRTLGLFDSIALAESAYSEAADAWRSEAVKGVPMFDTAQRQKVQGLQYDMDQAKKSVEFSKRCFMESAFKDIEASSA